VVTAQTHSTIAVNGEADAGPPMKSLIVTGHSHNMHHVSQWFATDVFQTSEAIQLLSQNLRLKITLTSHRDVLKVAPTALCRVLTWWRHPI
jgi:hypothetical protein